MTIQEAAQILLAAADEHEACAQLTEDWPTLTLAEGYAIQDELLRLRLARGEKIIGLKLGLTSRAKQVQMNIATPVTGWLTDAMLWTEGVTIPRARLIHPRTEPEIAFVLGERLSGAGLTAADVLRAVISVRAGLEVLDSRYRNFKFALPDVIADNSSGAGFVLGEDAGAPAAFDLAAEACELVINGEVVATATGADVLGHPAEAVARALDDLATRNIALEAGWIVLTGGMTDAKFITPGAQVSARFANLGTVNINGGE